MPQSRRVVGVDESGKGDFFGPLVVAAVLAPDSDLEELQELGVRDGKQITNKRVMALDEMLRDRYPHAVTIVSPADYNRLYAQIKNLNKLLAQCHAEVISQLCDSYPVDQAISDKFGKPELIEDELSARSCTVPLRQIVRGERFVQVAAASIVARAAFLQAMGDLATEYGVEIPRGAAPKVDQAGREIVRLFGVDVLPKLAKTHFKNFQRVVNPTLFTR